MEVYKQEHFLALYNDDFVKKYLLPPFYAAEADKPPLIEKLMKEGIPFFFESLRKKLAEHQTYFLCGDKLTLADFVIGGFFTNIVKNE